jgi:PilZ domain-containing protein
VPKQFAAHRNDKRIPMEVAVLLSGHKATPGIESTFTENVSARGARVVSVRRWDTNDRLTLASRAGDFRSTARVAYCQSLRETGYAVGVEFLKPDGRWVIQSLSDPFDQ